MVKLINRIEDTLIEALEYAVEKVGQEAGHAMNVLRANRDVVEEIEAKEQRFKRVLAALRAHEVRTKETSSG